MTARVRFEEAADAEYRGAGLWYEERRPGLGIEFFDAVDAALGQIGQFPQAGAPVPHVPADLHVRRAPVERFPYHVIYMVERATIRVLAIAHDRRHPTYWTTRM